MKEELLLILEEIKKAQADQNDYWFDCQLQLLESKINEIPDEAK